MCLLAQKDGVKNGLVEFAQLNSCLMFMWANDTVLLEPGHTLH